MKTRGELAARLQRTLHRQATEAAILSHAHDADSALPTAMLGGVQREPVLLRILDARLMSWTYLALCTVCSYPPFQSQWTGSVTQFALSYFPNISLDSLTTVSPSSLCWVCFDLKRQRDLQLGPNVYLSLETPQVIYPPQSLPVVSHSPSCVMVDPEAGIQAERDERAMNRTQQPVKETHRETPPAIPHFPLMTLKAVKPYSNNSCFSLAGMVQKASVRVKCGAAFLRTPMSFFCLQDNSGCLAIVEIPGELLDAWQWVMQSGEGAFIVISNVRLRKRGIVSLQQVPKMVEAFLELFEVGEVVWLRATVESSWAQIASCDGPSRYKGAKLSKEIPPLALSTATPANAPTTPAPSMCRVSVMCDPVACVEDNLHVTACSLPSSPLMNLVEANGKSCLVVQVHEVHNLEQYLSHRLLLRDLLVRLHGERVELVADLFTDILLAD